ncbi:flagellar hook protein FlgE [Photobacterium galatheae]|uniref:Flagellar hook protein FlgE n=1 Tax=Photobacterium galatheae TaxID=1654360 RepID=A0A066RP13_9GAMM|nr:flagellar hook-basal body complex protein [Photobacterium galatheae]KDM90856.1 hypothetical protein EA58_13935 [Photobacterium galatheae]MCM0149176.1 flagellar hook-basal body complex protein [Photobacterium galatheae]
MSDFSKIALSGLRAANSQLSVTSNNLANSETFGYKSQSVQFNALFASNGMNAMGIGTSLDATTTNFTNGSMIPTGDSLHHAIVGEGFFMVKDTDGGTKFTRVGLFEFNPEGVLIDNSGHHVQGYLANGSAGTTTDIILDKSPLAPEVSTTGTLDANLGTDDGTGSLTSSFSLFDALGKEHRLQVKFENKVTAPATGEATWDMSATVNGETINLGQIQFDANGQIKKGVTPFVDGALHIDLKTGLASPINGVPNVTIDMSKLTGYEGDTTIRNQEMDGAPVAEFEKYQIEENGNIVSYYKDGRHQPVGQIALAAVDNPDGMLVDGSYFSLSTNSGKMRVGVAGQAGFGRVTPGVIEGSNVNTTDELVSMISSQRFFQANAKVIGASKELNNALMQNV